MEPRIPGIEFSSRRDAGTCVQYTFGFSSDAEGELLSVVLAHLSMLSVISVPDPENGDCALEVRRAACGFEAKRGCHGASGTWRPASLTQAFEWLLPGAQWAAKYARPGYGGLLEIAKENA